MYLISTGKRTVLSDFADLNTRSVYEHKNGESTDFQCYGNKRIFVEVNKKCGNVEIMRVKEKQQKADIQRVRKLNIENVYCVACAKKSVEELALGLSNGQVKLYNYKNSEFVHRFQAESIRNSVLFLDYNASDDYISSVFENGQINIYGIKTKAKIDTINIDGSSTLARFHPTKKMHLSVASYKGSVTTYDIQTKKKIFHLSESHVAPCSDLCMSAALPDTLLSVGFDCVINIFDTRRRTKPIALTYCHPLSTVSMSDCGTYFCVGNLKGELSTFDMRNTEMCLATKRVHDCAVARIAFMPNEEESTSSGISFASSASSHSVTAASDVVSGGRIEQGEKNTEIVGLRKSLSGTLRGQRDSFCDFLDFQANKGTEKMSSRFSTRRDSFDWETLQRKHTTEHRGSIYQISSALSSANNSGVGTISDDDKQNSFEFGNTRSRGFSSALRDRNSLLARPRQITEKLMEITEEQMNKQEQDVSNSSDKENPPNELELSNRISLLQNVANSSTPNRENAKPESAQLTEFTASTGKPNYAHDDIIKEITALRTEMDERFQRLESNLKFNSETNKWHIFTQSFNLWNKQYQISEEMHFALSVLLRSDSVMNELMRLQEENELLKSQLIQAKDKL